MSDIQITGNEADGAIDEKELMDIFRGLDDDLINRQIDEMLAEKGECADMDSIKEKAFNRLEKGKNKRGIRKVAAVAAAVAALTVSTVYAEDIQRALQSFFGKSTVYQTVVDGDAYYLPDKLALSDKYTLRYVNMLEGRLEISIESTEEMSDQWFEGLELSVAEPDGGKNYTHGGYGFSDGALLVSFYKMPTLTEFELSLGGEVFPVSLTKAESLSVDESLAVGVPEKAGAPEAVDEGLSLIANVAASKTDEGSGARISIVVGFNDRDLKLNSLGVKREETVFSKEFENGEDGIIIQSGIPGSKPLIAYDAGNNAYELKEPANAIGRPVTVFETDAAPGTPLTLKVPAIEANYEKVVDRITIAIPKEGEIAIGEEIDFVIQKAVVKTVKRTSETTAEVTFDLNTGADKSVKIRDISAYSKDVVKGETIITGDTAVLTLTFDKDAEKTEIEFSWPHFIIEGDWSVELE